MDKDKAVADLLQSILQAVKAIQNKAATDVDVAALVTIDEQLWAVADDEEV
jgi:hypothetical protein